MESGNAGSWAETTGEDIGGGVLGRTLSRESGSEGIAPLSDVFENMAPGPEETLTPDF
jgi:hypothetical protein